MQVEGKTPEDVERDRGLAVQVKLYRERRGRYNAGHLRNFQKLAATPGVTGRLRPGTAVEVVRSARSATRREDEAMLQRVNGDSDDEMEDVEEMRLPAPASVAENGQDPLDEDDEGKDAREERVGNLLYHISRLGLDDGDCPRAEADG